jgi:hypothetical protein
MRRVGILLIVAIIAVIIIIVCDEQRETFKSGAEEIDHKYEIAQKIKTFMDTEPEKIQLQDYLQMIGQTTNRSSEVLKPGAFNAIKYLAKQKTLTTENITRLMSDV